MRDAGQQGGKNESGKAPGRVSGDGVRLILACWAALVHFAFLAGIGFFLIVIMPEYKVLFQDLQQALPLQTRVCISASSLVRGYWYLVPPAVGAFFAIDVFVIFGLSSLRSGRFVRYWFYIVSLVFIAAMAFSLLSIHLPVQNLKAGGASGREMVGTDL